MNFIAVDVDAEEGWLSVSNDGAGIPVEKHNEENL
jgi:DNA gyrase/topoisomerase IV subunit B